MLRTYNGIFEEMIGVFAVSPGDPEEEKNVRMTLAAVDRDLVEVLQRKTRLLEDFMVRAIASVHTTQLLINFMLSTNIAMEIV